MALAIDLGLAGPDETISLDSGEARRQSGMVRLAPGIDMEGVSRMLDAFCKPHIADR